MKFLKNKADHLTRSKAIAIFYMRCETYFETVEFILGLDARHYQNYLALCPNHSAMFKYANNCEDLILSLFLSIEDSDEMEVILAQKDLTIRFTETHIADLKKVIEVDSAR